MENWPEEYIIQSNSGQSPQCPHKNGTAICGVPNWRSCSSSRNISANTWKRESTLWKLVMKKAAVYRSYDNKLTVNIYPNLPK